MASFDCTRAWSELAYPAFQKLMKDAAVKVAYGIVVANVRDLSQSPTTLDVVPMPEGLVAAFAGIDDDTLALASHAVYYAGHWAPIGSPTQDFGVNWKFSGLADVELSRRCGLPVPRKEEFGNIRHYRVQQGFMHVRMGVGVEWRNEDFGPATPAFMAAARAIPDVPLATPGMTRHAALESFMAAHLALRPADGPFAPWFGVVERYQETKPWRRGADLRGMPAHA